MLNDDPKRLRWLAMPMHARWQRRSAVVLTYVAAFAMSVAVAGREWNAFGHPYLALWALAAVVAFGGIFRDGGVVKSFEVRKQRAGAMMMVGSLDEWARYKFGTAGFEESSEEQQKELLSAYRVGTYLVPQDRARPRCGLPDEREAAERDRVSRRTLVWLGSYISYIAASYSVRGRPVASLDIVAMLLSFAVLAMTLPKAMVLWEETDPEESRELQVVSPSELGSGAEG